MFKITDAEKLRDAYTLLAFIRDDVPTTTAEQKSGMAAFMVSIKKEIRAYNNRPAPDSRIVEEHGIDGYIELVQLPNELDTTRLMMTLWQGSKPPSSQPGKVVGAAHRKECYIWHRRKITSYLRLPTD